MKIQVKKQVTEIVEMEVETPAYYVDFGIYYKLTPDFVINVGRLWIRSEAVKDASYPTVSELIKYSKVTEQEFTDAYNKALQTINSTLHPQNISELELQEG